MSRFDNSNFIILHINGVYYSVPRYCPHRGGDLRYGYINYVKKTITCPLHRSCFSLETGRQISGPQCGSINVQRGSSESGAGY